MDKKKKRYADVARTPPAPAPRKPAAPSPAESIQPLTQRVLKQDIKTFTAQFKTSSRYHSLATFLEEGQNIKITQCICLGLGRFRDFHGDFNASLHRLAMLEKLLKKLAKRGNREKLKENKNEIQVFFQSAAFTDSEKFYLRSNGYDVLPNDDISVRKRMESPNTFLFAPYLSAVRLSTAVMDGNFPALYIGPDLNEAIEDICRHCTEEELERYSRPLLRYKSASFEGKQLPILAHRAAREVESWKNASVRWLGAADSGDGGGGMGVERRVRKEGGRDGKVGTHQSTLAPGSGEKGKGEEIIDWWSYEPTSVGR